MRNLHYCFCSYKLWLFLSNRLFLRVEFSAIMSWLTPAFDDQIWLTSLVFPPGRWYLFICFVSFSCSAAHYFFHTCWDISLERSPFNIELSVVYIRLEQSRITSTVITSNPLTLQNSWMLVTLNQKPSQISPNHCLMQYDLTLTSCWNYWNIIIHLRIIFEVLWFHWSNNYLSKFKFWWVIPFVSCEVRVYWICIDVMW